MYGAVSSYYGHSHESGIIEPCDFQPCKFVSVRPQLTLASNGKNNFDIVQSIIILAANSS